MSQFQQPQDNRYVRPGVVDLGTGRQFERLSVSQRGTGSTGSGTGGGFVQGQSRTGTGLSGVDPLAQILGAASTGINAFLEADQTMAESEPSTRKAVTITFVTHFFKTAGYFSAKIKILD